jgi:hypothetical protein
MALLSKIKRLPKEEDNLAVKRSAGIHAILWPTATAAGTLTAVQEGMSRSDKEIARLTTLS